MLAVDGLSTPKISSMRLSKISIVAARGKGSVNKSGSSLFGGGTGEEKQETPKKL